MSDPVSAHEDPEAWLRREAEQAHSRVHASALRACADRIEELEAEFEARQYWMSAVEAATEDEDAKRLMRAMAIVIEEDRDGLKHENRQLRDERDEALEALNAANDYILLLRQRLYAPPDKKPYDDEMNEAGSAYTAKREATAKQILGSVDTDEEADDDEE